jgi:hypothetical protein
MNIQIRRYVFVDFESMKKIKFRKLEKVCDKVFVFISGSTELIPFALVKEMQRMGGGVKWIEVDSPQQGDIHYHMCFLMGKLHEKISGDVEFAILSDDQAFDPLVNFISSTGRSCIRVKQQSQPVSPESVKEDTSRQAPNQDMPKNMNGKAAVPASEVMDMNLYDENTQVPPLQQTPTAPKSSEKVSAGKIDDTARDTVQRLIRSGNRPAEVVMLKNYILLHNQDNGIHSSVEKVIKRLEETAEIDVRGGEVIYHF